MTLQFQLAAMTVLSMVQTLLQILNGACLMTIIWGVREGDGRRKKSRNPREIEKYITNKVLNKIKLKVHKIGNNLCQLVATRIIDDFWHNTTHFVLNIMNIVSNG